MYVWLQSRPPPYLVSDTDYDYETDSDTDTNTHQNETDLDSHTTRDHDSQIDINENNEMTITSCTEIISQLTEDEIMRNINHPIYISKYIKWSDLTSGQAHRKKHGRLYNNTYYYLFCKKQVQRIDRHLKTHKEFVKDGITNTEIAKLRKQGDHENNTRVIQQNAGEIILARRPEEHADVKEYGPWLLGWHCYHCPQPVRLVPFGVIHLEILKELPHCS